MILDEFLQLCPICLIAFDSENNIPMVICYEQHLCCQSCIQSYLKHALVRFKCPFCRNSQFPINKIKKFRHYASFQDKVRQISSFYQKSLIGPQNIQNPKGLPQRKVIRINYGLLIEGKRLELQKIVKNLMNQAKQLLIFARFQDASYILETFLENSPELDEGEFFGLGCHQQSVGYYQNNICRWFITNYYFKNVSAYDLLAISYLIKPNYQEQIDWYKKLVEKYPKDIKFAYGLAITLHNADNLEEAQKIYLKIIQIAPQFSKSWQMLGFIYLKRLKHQQCLAYAKKCLQLDSNNIYAKFLVAQSKDNSSERKLKVIFSQQNQYVRPLNSLAQFYYFIRQVQKAEYYWNKCIQINCFYYDPVLSKANLLLEQKQFSKCIKLLIALDQDMLKKSQKEQYNRILGQACYLTFDDKKAIFFFELQFQDKRYEKDVQSLEMLMLSYINQNEQRKAVSICEFLLLKHPQNKVIISKCQNILIQRSYQLKKYKETVSRVNLYKHKKYNLDRKILCYLAWSYYYLSSLGLSGIWCKYCIDNNIEIEQMKKLRENLSKYQHIRKCQQKKKLKTSYH